MSTVELSFVSRQQQLDGQQGAVRRPHDQHVVGIFHDVPASLIASTARPRCAGPPHPPLGGASTAGAPGPSAVVAAAIDNPSSRIYGNGSSCHRLNPKAAGRLPGRRPRACQRPSMGPYRIAVPPPQRSGMQYPGAPWQGTPPKSWSIGDCTHFLPPLNTSAALRRTAGVPGTPRARCILCHGCQSLACLISP